MVVRNVFVVGVVLMFAYCPCRADGSHGSPNAQPNAQQQQSLPPEGALHFMMSPPGAAFYPQYVPGPYPPYMPINGAASYQWGYFGARSKPSHYGHSGYHNDQTNWFTPRR